MSDALLALAALIFLAAVILAPLGGAADVYSKRDDAFSRRRRK